jgi:hypothetical protein
MAMMDCIANGRCQHGDGGQGGRASKSGRVGLFGQVLARQHACMHLGGWS